MINARYNQSKILIVDDQQDNLQLMLNSLFEGGYKNILCSTCGEDAIDIALKELPDIILMDWDMPGISGVEAIIELRKHNESIHTPIIITTGAMMESADLKYAFESGATDYIRKPFDKIELLARVQSAMDISGYILTIEHQQEELAHQQTESLKNQQRLKAFVEASSEAIAFTKDNLITQVSNRFCIFTGLSESELVGKSVLSIVMPEEKMKLMQLMDTEDGREQFSILTKDGAYQPCLIHHHLFINNGDTIQVLSCFRRGSTDVSYADTETITTLKNETIKLQGDLELVQREMALQSMKLYQSNELLNKLLKQLKELKELPQTANKKCQTEINRIVKEIAMVINDTLWDELKLRIGAIHPTYFKNLLRQYPALTETDLRMLAFIKLNLSTKEIADITCQSVNTIKSARKRLRQRMNMTDSQDSLAVILARY